MGRAIRSLSSWIRVVMYQFCAHVSPWSFDVKHEKGPGVLEGPGPSPLLRFSSGEWLREFLAAAAGPASVSFHATQWPCPGMTVPKSFSAPQPLGLSFRPLRGFDDSRPIFWSIRSRATGLNLFQAHESPPTVFPVAKSIFKGKALRAFEMFASRLPPCTPPWCLGFFCFSKPLLSG